MLRFYHNGWQRATRNSYRLYKVFYTEWINAGKSCIVDHKGNVIAGPLEMKEEIIYAEINLALITEAKRMFDVAGHYARPDVFNFNINREPNDIKPAQAGLIQI